MLIDAVDGCVIRFRPSECSFSEVFQAAYPIALDEFNSYRKLYGDLITRVPHYFKKPVPCTASTSCQWVEIGEAGEDLKQGDLVVVSDDGKVRKAENSNFTGDHHAQDS